MERDGASLGLQPALTTTVPSVAPQRKGTVPAHVEKRLTELAALYRESEAQLEIQTVRAMEAGGSYRELERITGIPQTRLARWVKRAGGLARVEADIERRAERQRRIDEIISPEVQAMLRAIDRGDEAQPPAGD